MPTNLALGLAWACSSCCCCIAEVAGFGENIADCGGLSLDCCDKGDDEIEVVLVMDCDNEACFSLLTSPSDGWLLWNPCVTTEENRGSVFVCIG